MAALTETPRSQLAGLLTGCAWENPAEAGTAITLVTRLADLLGHPGATLAQNATREQIEDALRRVYRRRAPDESPQPDKGEDVMAMLDRIFETAQERGREAVAARQKEIEQRAEQNKRWLEDHHAATIRRQTQLLRGSR